MFGPLDMMAILRRVAALARWRFRSLEGIVSQHLAVARMVMIAGRLAFAFVLAALCLSPRAADAQAAPVPYWIPGWPLGFGGNLTAGQSANPYSNFTTPNFPSGWFAVANSRPAGLSMNGIGQGGAFDNIGSLDRQGMQFGYHFQNAGGLPVTVYAGFDTLKYNPGILGPVAPLDAMSGTTPGYSAHAGVAFQPAPNVSLSLGLGYTQEPGR
jgi:opacity protein-like surface antigen